MDFILFYSKFSEKSAALLQEIPLLNEKAVCIDSAESRTLLRGLPYPVKRVPTLFVTDGINKIIKVLEGVQEIRNWFLLVTYSMSAAEPEPEPEQQLPPTSAHTSVDDLLPPSPMESSEYAPKGGKTGDVRNIAEELQRERESYLEATQAPNKFTQVT